MSKVHQRASSGALRLVLVYALFSALWILLSDQVVGRLFDDPQAVVRASTVKGWLFVVVTSALLYALVRRLTGQLAAAHARELALERENRKPPPMLVAIAEASADAIFAKDEAGRYVLMNTAAARVVGKSVEQALGMDNHALFPPEQAERLMAVDRRVMASGQPETHVETLHTASGVRVYLSTKGPLRGPDGRIFGTYGIARDITESRQAEQDYRQLADDLSATLQAIPDLMFEVDAQGRYIRVKALDEALLAAPSAQILGQTVNEVLPPEAAATVMQALAAAAVAGTDFGRSISLSLAGGVHHFELSVARKPALAGQGERFIVLSRDVTTRHQAEAELRQRNQELERFNRAATERELRMVALKREVNALAQAAGRAPPYDVSFADPEPPRAAG